MVVGYFQGHFGSMNTEVKEYSIQFPGELLLRVPKDADDLVKPISSSEFQDALLFIHKDKTPGLNVFSSGFFMRT